MKTNRMMGPNDGLIITSDIIRVNWTKYGQYQKVLNKITTKSTKYKVVEKSDFIHPDNVVQTMLEH